MILLFFIQIFFGGGSGYLILMLVSRLDKDCNTVKNCSLSQTMRRDIVHRMETQYVWQNRQHICWCWFSDLQFAVFYYNLKSDMPKTNVLVIRYKENGWYVNAMSVSIRQEMQTLSVCLFVCLSICLLVWSSATLVYMSLVHLRKKNSVSYLSSIPDYGKQSIIQGN